MTRPHVAHTLRSRRRRAFPLAALAACAPFAAGQALLGAAPAHGSARSPHPAARSPYPAGATRSLHAARRFESAHSAAATTGGSTVPTGGSPGAGNPKAKPCPSRSGSSKPQRPRPMCKPKPKPVLHGDPARALLALEAMQRYYYIAGSGLYQGEPFSYLWPFSQALAATVTMASVQGIAKIPGLANAMRREVNARLTGLRAYWDSDNSGQPEGTFTSTLAAYDGTVAPPAGPGGAKYYDDNEWVGIELARIYRLTHEPAILASAESLMAFVMAGWDEHAAWACPGGVPFSNLPESGERNTVTNAPGAELGVVLYRITGNAAYLQFAEKAYEWVRHCLLEYNGLYADHIGDRGVVTGSYWSYNQGAMIGAGALLYQATRNGAYLWQARQTAKAALAHFTPERLAGENPFFVSVYFRNMLYLDSLTHDPPGTKLAQPYVDYAWQHLRLADNLFVFGSPPGGDVLTQAAIVQIYGLLSSPPSTYF
jgi:Glycosyl hydrolase family 76